MEILQITARLQILSSPLRHRQRLSLSAQRGLNLKNYRGNTDPFCATDAMSLLALYWTSLACHIKDQSGQWFNKYSCGLFVRTVETRHAKDRLWWHNVFPLPLWQCLIRINHNIILAFISFRSYFPIRFHKSLLSRFRSRFSSNHQDIWFQFQ